MDCFLFVPKEWPNRAPVVVLASSLRNARRAIKDRAVSERFFRDRVYAGKDRGAEKGDALAVDGRTQEERDEARERFRAWLDGTLTNKTDYFA